MRKDGKTLRKVSPELQKDREVVLTAAQSCIDALAYAPQELWSDREFVLAGVQLSGLALQHASCELRADREIVIVAVRNHGGALKFAADDLQSDEELTRLASTDLLHTQERVHPVQSDTPEAPEAKLHSFGPEKPGSAKALSAPATDECVEGAVAQQPVPCMTLEHDGNNSCIHSGVSARGTKERMGTGPCTASGPATQFQLFPACVRSPVERPRGQRLFRSNLGALRLLPVTSRPTGSEEDGCGSWEGDGKELEGREEAKELQEGPVEVPLRSLDDVKLGDSLRVLHDVATVLGACRAAGLEGDAEEATWRASAGRQVQVLALDPIDGTLECRVPGVGDVWLAPAALIRLSLPRERPLEHVGEALPGAAVRVLHDAAAVLQACRCAGLGSFEEETAWEASTGKTAEVLRRDPKDRTVECRVPGVGDVLFAVAALTRAD
mmetsp:Transcript_237/g.764  ORF Transcript_237/g.764 Transcript_237/m.764 type:complete len:439 (-) Transcript_237:361-1677(-)